MQQVARQEKKYLTDVASATRLRGRLRHVLHEDEHGGADGYRVRSLYFDTVNDRDYEEKFAGTDPRRKVRLRIYDPHAETALLEMKQKSGEHQLKRSLELSRDEALRLIAGDLSWMPTRPEAFAAEMYGVIQMHGYRPKAIVEYRRCAFVARELKTRITFARCPTYAR